MAISLALSGCSTPHTPPDVVEYKIRLVDTRKTPISDAEVAANWGESGPTRRAFTDRNGAATLRLPSYRFSSLVVSYHGLWWDFDREEIPSSRLLILGPKRCQLEYKTGLFRPKPLTLDRSLTEIAASPEIRRAVGGLSPKALRFLLSYGNIGSGYLKKDWEHTDSAAPMVIELQEKGFVDVTGSDERTSRPSFQFQFDSNGFVDVVPVRASKVTGSDERDSYPNRFTLTQDGKSAYELVLKALFDQVFSKPTTDGKP
jgi:hypothetical protein